jgi:hypothetical protein
MFILVCLLALGAPMFSLVFIFHVLFTPSSFPVVCARMLFCVAFLSGETLREAHGQAPQVPQQVREKV